ncbi:hypothetical protein [Falsiroseomonas sp. CW058]|uniref:hypothetical protein n=1 Tax=Falsiroseomonas sp. CW058 TaxID=3388664 RepID=UPI003D31768B
MPRMVAIAAALLLAACTGAADDAAQSDIEAARAVTMSGPAVSWEALGVHPGLQARACGVSTLVTAGGEVVGYCTGGRRCRTMDWRPVEDGCGNVAQRRTLPAPAMPPAEPPRSAEPPTGLMAGRR